jgi:hypothetical protein
VALLVAGDVVGDTFPVDVHMGVDDQRPTVGSDDEPGCSNPGTGDCPAGAEL